MTKLKTNTDGKKLASLSLVSINICTKFYASRIYLCKHLILNFCLFFCNKKYEKKNLEVEYSVKFIGISFLKIIQPNVQVLRA